MLFFWICCSLRSPTSLQQNFGYCGTSFFLLFFPFTLNECKGCVLPILPHPPDVPSCRPRQRRQRSSPRRSSRVRSAEAPRSRTAVRAVRGAVPGRAPLPAPPGGAAAAPRPWRRNGGAAVERRGGWRRVPLPGPRPQPAAAVSARPARLRLRLRLRAALPLTIPPSFPAGSASSG